MEARHVTRRSFLLGLNLSLGGLALGFFPGAALALENSVQRIRSTFDPNVFIHVSESGEVTIVCHRSEMGQGIRSSLPVLLADEMGASMERVRVVQADGDKAYGDQNTDGSTSIRSHWEELRRAAATARTVLIAAAATKLSVPPGSLVARDGTVTHDKTKRSLSFGDLAPIAAKLPIPKSVKLRPDSELLHLGKELPLLDGPAYVTGKAVYAADVRLPGLLVAVIARPPVVGARVKKLDASSAKKIPGVRHVIEMPAPKKPWAFQPWGGVAVVADNTWAALRGRAALVIEWTESENDGYDSAKFRGELARSVSAPGKVHKQKGDAEAALQSAAQQVEAEYYVPHLPHLSMEPPCATAHFDNGKLEVWASTQAPQRARTEAAKTLGIPEQDVTVHVTFLGGAFGRKSKADFVAEAAVLAKKVGAPVRVQWTREDDVQHDYYNTVSFQRLSAGLDAEKKVVAWRRRTAFPPIASVFNATADTPSAGDLQQGVLDLALSVPNVRAEACSAKAHVRIGWLRSVYNIFHGFATGSFMDEIAHARRIDPRENLLELIGAPRKLSLSDLGISDLSNYGAPLSKHPVDAGRLRGVVERVTDACGWSHRKDRALGLAAHRSFLSYVATVVSLVKEGNRVRADEVWVALDAGIVVNAERARSQMEGAVIFGLNLALFGGVTFEKGRAQQTNFHDLRLLRIADAPRKIHVEIVKSDQLPGGIGEPGVPPVAPALANAWFALSGKRARSLPFGKDLNVG
ncbi:MAG: xanthine dehydrogenase family protein molybdopterin-binding subunit [Myxococcales bacterium]|nr:xanthine dehydrogenase family protein molybdopterin-binding subunit [Myxococcales bacterium]MCB9575541.1 xanthine dehydrogenase family protein molybdopterin-binding subunit [Polyangiaceae bacterium]